MTWIPCSERLPNKYGQYLVTILIFGDKYVDILNFAKGKFYESDDEWGDVDYTDEVIAWTLLPIPYGIIAEQTEPIDTIEVGAELSPKEYYISVNGDDSFRVMRAEQTER